MQIKSMFTRLIALGGAVIVLLGCSATEYTTPIATFSDATTAADSALQNLNKVATDKYTAFLAQRVRVDPRTVVMAIERGSEKDCELLSKRCQLALVDSGDPSKTQLYPPDPLLGNMVAVMGDIRLYAQNLAVLANDASATKAQASISATLASIQTLANTVAKAQSQSPTIVPNFAMPVGAAVNWLVGQYANQVKLQGLRTATEEANPVIQRASLLFKNAAVFGSDPQRVELTRSLRARLDAFQDNRSAANLDAAVDAAKSYDMLLRSQPGATFRKMGEAHAALTEALHNPDTSWSNVIVKIQDFATQAQQLAKIVEDLTALANKKS